jgi:hypothetical protein
MEELFPGKVNIYSNYRELNAREFAVVACAVIDAAVAELISLRLRDAKNDELESFLGVNNDGRAPCASLGAKLQLGYLLGILTESDLYVLRGFKNIRNKFPHSVNASFSNNDLILLVTNVHKLWLKRAKQLIEKNIISGTTNELESLADQFESEPEACHGFLLGVFCIYASLFS